MFSGVARSVSLVGHRESGWHKAAPPRGSGGMPSQEKFEILGALRCILEAMASLNVIVNYHKV